MAYYTRPSTTLGSGAGRSTTLLVPNAYDPAKSYPLYVVLHNYDDPGGTILSRLQLEQGHNFDDGAFIICPDGEPDGASNAHFNYWTLGGDFDYISDLIAEAVSLGWSIDATRIYGVGYSNGGFMIRQLVDNNPSLFTATVTICGGLSGTNDSNDAGIAVPGIHIHGDSDLTVLPAGDAAAATLPGSLAGHGGVGSTGYVSVANTIAAMKTRNGESGALESAGADINLVSADGGGAECVRQKVAGTSAATAIESWTLTTVDHAISLVDDTWLTYIHTWLETNHRGA
jgi:poly(3-hydroxybutyrate) depolymerase